MTDVDDIRRIDPDSQVGKLIAQFRRSTATIAVDYTSLDTAALTYLRRMLRDCGADWTQFEIVRNTLARIAADHASLWDLRPYLTGVTALIFIDGDIGKVIAAIRRFHRAFPLPIKAGVVQGRVVDAASILELADPDLEPEEQTEAVEEAAPLVEVTLVNAGTKRIAVIKELRQALMLGLAEAKNVADQAPVVIARELTAEDAQNLVTRLESAGAQVTTA